MSSRGLKGQFAIEYLMTYGWMLLVVAITGGAIFATVGSQSTDSVSGFTGSDIIVDDFGVTGDNELGLSARNGAGNEIVVSRVNASDPDSGDFVYKEFNGDNRIGVGSEKIFELPNVSRGDGSNSLDVEIVYDSGGLSNLSVSGTVSGNLELNGSGSFEGLPKDDHKFIEEKPSMTNEIDDFEETSSEENYDFVPRDEYTKNLTLDYQTSLVKEGSKAGNLTINISRGPRLMSGGFIISSSGLENYPQRGDKFEATFSPRNTNRADYSIRMAFGMNSIGAGYIVQLYQNELPQIRRSDGRDLSSGSILGSKRFSEIDADNWYIFRVDWDDDNNITAYLLDEGENEIASVSAVDSTYSDQRGFGWGMTGYAGLSSGFRHSALLDDAKLLKE